MSTSPQASPKVNGQRFVCGCGRSFSTEITIRETTNVDATSPPATPMLLLKTDLKLQQQQQHLQESVAKRARMMMIENPTSVIPTTTNNTMLVDRLNASSIVPAWPTASLKNYEDSPGKVLIFGKNFNSISIHFF